MTARKIYLRIFLVTVLGMGASMALFRLFAWLNDASAETILERVTQARAALPRIVEQPEDLVMFYGSSMTQAGISARVFDRELAAQGVDVKSFNFGFGGINPLFQDYLARRVREAFQANDRRLKLAIIEFNPFQTTQARYNGAVEAIDSFITMLATDAELWKIAKEDPERGALLFNIRYLRGQLSAEITTNFLAGFLRPPRPGSDIEEPEEITQRRRELGEKLGEKFEEEYPDYDGSAWNWGWQGAGTIPEERSQETLDIFVDYYEVVRSEKLLTDDRLNRIRCCDIVDLHFEEQLIEAFIRMVEAFKQFSDQVDVIMLPRNTDWITYPPEARQRLDETIARIEAATGITIKDFQDLPQITPQMFSDTTHLARYGGDVPFTDFLAEHYAPVLSTER